MIPESETNIIVANWFLEAIATSESKATTAAMHYCACKAKDTPYARGIEAIGKAHAAAAAQYQRHYTEWAILARAKEITQ